MRRKLFFGVLTVTLFVAGFSLASSRRSPSCARSRSRSGGQKVVTTVDVPPGTPPEPIQLPELSAPIRRSRTADRPNTEDAGADNGGDDTADKPQTDTKKSPGEFLDEGKPEKPKKCKNKTKPGDIRRPDGSPTRDNPTLSLGLPGPAPVGVPNFVISKFRIPPFLLPIYQAAGIAVRHPLGGARRDQRDRDRLRPQPQRVVRRARSAGCSSCPSTWRTYGVDANEDGVKDPYNPVDAIFAAARYLKAAGGDNDLRRAIFAYNHADWYVDSVLMRARLIAGMPADLVGSLTGLTAGPLPRATPRARYADDLARARRARVVKPAQNARTTPPRSSATTDRRSINIYRATRRAGDRRQRRRRQEDRQQRALGRYVVLQDVYGNRYTYAHLGAVAKRYPVPRSLDDAADRATSSAPPQRADSEDEACPSPSAPRERRPPATAGRRHRSSAALRLHASADGDAAAADGSEQGAPVRQPRPRRATATRRADAGQQHRRAPAFEVFKVYFSSVLRLSLAR